MIHYVVTGPHAYTVTGFLETFGAPLRGRFRWVSYELLFRLRRYPPGTWIFSDLERLSGEQAREAGRIRDLLAGAGEGWRVLNHPSRSLRRYALLRTLRERGLNEFDVHRPGEGRPLRYPVFLRGEDDHEGSRTGLLTSPAEVEAALRSPGRPAKALLTEFCETADGEGVYRKYAAFRIGGAVIPRHILFSRKWMLKEVDLAGEAEIAEERAYLESNPHRRALEEAFDLAGIDYGRADYGVKEGRIQIFEINTNPMLTGAENIRPPARRPIHEAAGRRIVEAFLAIEAKPIRRGLLTRWFGSGAEAR